MKMEGKHPRGRLKLRWKDTVTRVLKAWNIREEWTTPLTRKDGKVSARLATPHRETALKGEKRMKTEREQQRTFSLPSTTSCANLLTPSTLRSTESGLNLTISSPSLMKRIDGHSSFLRPKNSRILPLSSTSMSR